MDIQFINKYLTVKKKRFMLYIYFWCNKHNIFCFILNSLKKTRVKNRTFSNNHNKFHLCVLHAQTHYKATLKTEGMILLTYY